MVQEKSILLNMVTDKLSPIEGFLLRNGRLRIGIFTQHTAKFDLQYSSVQNMLQIVDSSIDQEMRSWLINFQIQGNELFNPMLILSGGRKKRVVYQLK